MEEKAYKVIVSGRVTGIGFRYCAMDYALTLPGLKGYVMNRSSGEVEAFVQGPPEQVSKMIDWLCVGPRGARVDDFQVIEVPVDSSAGPFTIKHSWRV